MSSRDCFATHSGLSLSAGRLSLTEVMKEKRQEGTVAARGGQDAAPVHSIPANFLAAGRGVAEAA
jgi:hypothetical protein